jgi:hypothetical protein
VRELQEEADAATGREGALEAKNATFADALRGQAEQLRAVCADLAALQAAGGAAPAAAAAAAAAAAVQFDPSEDILLKYPVTAANGTAEHIWLGKVGKDTMCALPTQLIAQKHAMSE